MLLSNSVTVFAAERPADSQDVQLEQMRDDSDKIPEIAEPDPNEVLTVIVELDDSVSVMSADDDAVLERQDDLCRVIGEEVLDDKELEPSFRYTTVANGFAIDIPYGKLQEVKEVPGVKEAYAAPQFTLAPDAKPNTNLLSGMSNSSGYDGQGMVIAVIDSGMAVDHPAFKGEIDSPALTKADVKNALDTKDLKAESFSYNLSVENVYKSEKVPFAYDYADKDSDVTPTYDDHGTHVSGIAAGMTEEACGVASQAQILAMKTFSSYGSGGWDAILAALDDAVALGADVINMSLGMASGFSSPESDRAIYSALERASEAGVLISTAAGNEYNSAYGGKVGRDRPLTVNPDYGSMDTPASLSPAMAVASVEKEGAIESSYFTVNEGRKIAFWDTAETGSAPSGAVAFKELGSEPVPYVAVPNHGRPESYGSLDVSGKIALVQRGGNVTYDQMKDAAKEAGASGLLVYNNVPGMLYMGFTKYDLPAAFISQVDGEFLAKLSQDAQTITISMTSGEVASPTSGQMSDFSAWGVTPEMKLKPDITAPGGNIMSAVGENRYDLKSGTSMAAPFIAGSMAVVKQYLQQAFPGQSASELTNAVIMSTAELVKSDGVPYSPRKQGAGNVNVDKAISSPAYLTVSGMDRPKIELGDDIDQKGIYELSFQVHNLTGNELTYTLGGTVQTDAVEPVIYQGRSIPQSTELPYLLEAEIAPQTVTVPENGTVTVTTTVKLTEQDRAYMTENFPNGGYVEGFLTLTPDGSEQTPSLSLPYLAFFGDWTRPAVIDRGYYWDELMGNADHSSQYTNTAAVLSRKPGTSDSVTTLLGNNPYHDDVLYLADRNAISPNGDKSMDQLDRVLTGLLRSVKKLTYTIAEEGHPENIYYTKSAEWKGKSVYSTDNNEVMPAGGDPITQMDPWAGTDSKGRTLPNNSKARVTVACELPYSEHEVNNENISWSFPITVDLEAPAVDVKVGSEADKFQVKLTVSDNQYVSNILLTNANGKNIIASEPVAETAAGAEVIRTYDVSGYGEKLKLVVNDYAGNRVEQTIAVPGNPDDHKIIAPTTPLDESFGENELPVGWETESKSYRSGKYTWGIAANANAADRKKMPYCDADKTGENSEPQDEWLITRSVNLKDEDRTASLTFDFYANYFYAVQKPSYDLLVMATMDGGDTWDELWSLNDWDKGEWWPAPFATAQVEIPAKFQNAEELKLAFVYQGVKGSYIYLDNVQMPLTDGPETSDSYTIAASAGTGGTISPSGDISVDAGADQTFRISADTRYEINEILVDGQRQKIADTYTFENVRAPHTISVSFKEKEPAGTVLIEENFDMLSRFPEGWTVEGSSKEVLAGTWKVGSFWSMSKSGKQAVCGVDFTNAQNRAERLILPEVDLKEGGVLSFDAGISAMADLGNTVQMYVQASLNGEDWETIWDASQVLSAPGRPVDDYLGHGEVNIPQAYQKEGVRLAFYFECPSAAYTEGAIDNVKLIGYGSEPQPTRKFTITASAGEGGTISPVGSIEVAAGASQSFTITAEEGYEIDKILVDSEEEGIKNTYTFADVQAGHTISVTFKEIAEEDGTVLIDEDFNALAVFPEGWSVEGPGFDNKRGGTWKIGSFWGLKGSVKTALCDVDYSAAEARNERLIMPALDLSKGGVLTFDAGLSSTAVLGETAGLKVQASLNGKDWETIWDASEYLDKPMDSFTDITGQGKVIIPDKYKADGVRLAFLFETPNANFIQAAVDNVKLVTDIEVAPPALHTIAASAGVGGSISPNGTVTMAEGTKKRFQISAADGYEIEDVLVDGKSVGAVDTYVFSDIDGDHTIAALFRELPPRGPVLIEENFNSITVFPEDWTVEGTSKDAGSTTWGIGSFFGLPGSVKSAVCNSSFTNNKDRNEKLIMPPVDLTDGGELTFDAGISYGVTLGGDVRLTVQASVNGKDWDVIWDAADQLKPPASFYDDIVGQGIVLEIPEKYHKDDVKIAFVFESPANQYFQGAIDNVVLRGGLKPETPDKGSGGHHSSSSVVSQTTVKNSDGSVTVTVQKKDGTVIKTTTAEDGTKAVATVRNGVTTVKVELPAEVKKSPVRLPVAPVADKAVIEIDVANGKETRVLIPVSECRPGMTAVIVNGDGTEEVVRRSIAREDGIELVLNKDSMVRVVDMGRTFIDVPGSHWAADSIAFVTARSLFSGTGENTFSPAAPMTRGMLAMVLNNLENNPAAAVSSVFTDVDENQWYANATDWAAERGIISGYGNGRMGPNDLITREQLAVMLYKYAGMPKVEHPEMDFADMSEVSDWALTAMTWAVDNGIMSGVGNNKLDPQGVAARDQVACMLYNFLSI